MAQRTFAQRTDNIYLWKEIAELHWERLLGEFNNDELFWNDLFHSMEHIDWEDLVEVAKGIKIAHSEETRRYPKFDYQIEVIEKRLHKCDPVIKQWNRQGYNSPATGLFMTVRDILNEINGTPTRRWTDKEKAKVRSEKEKNTFRELFSMGD